MLVILMGLKKGFDALTRNQANIMPEFQQSPGNVMRARAWLHANYAGRKIAEPDEELAAQNLGAHDDRNAFILSDQVKRVLAGIDPDNYDLGGDLLLVWHRKLLSKAS